MRIDIISLFPEMFEGFLDFSIIKRAKEKELAEIFIHNLRDFSDNKHRKVDDYAYGGGAGMVMMVQPIADCIDKLKTERNYDEIVFLTPDGTLFDQKVANKFSLFENIILLCGHYKGVDQRIRDNYITCELSIGNYVLTGGEIAAAAISDAIIRLIPGVLNDECSALNDSFQDGLLAPPVYTRPANYKGMCVPEVLLSGNAKEIENWKLQQSIDNTKNQRPELLNDDKNF